MEDGRLEIWKNAKWYIREWADQESEQWTQ